MPKVLILQSAYDDLARLDLFLAEKDQDAATRMKTTIKKHLNRLKSSPNLGSPFGQFKKLVVRFGKSRYIVIYKYLKSDDVVFILSIWHGRENRS